MTSLSLQYGPFHYSQFANIQTPTISTFFNRFRCNWYQNSWFNKIFRIKHSNRQGCRLLLPLFRNHDICRLLSLSLICVCTLIAYVANNMAPDQTRSCLTRIHSACFLSKKLGRVTPAYNVSNSINSNK